MALPAWLVSAGVSTSVVPSMAALPFVTHPPPGPGTTPPDGCAMATPLKGILIVLAGLTPSVVVRVYCPMKVPLLCGVKLTGTVMSSPGLIDRPADGGTGAPNGASGAVKPVTVSGRLPVLVKVTSVLTDLPSATLLKATEVREAVSVPLPATLTPVSGTVTDPPESVTVSEPASADVTCVGLYVTVTGTAWPGCSTVPCARPVMLNGAAGGVTELTVSAVVPVLTMLVVKVGELP